ncbi:MAG: response regulator [Candidatus Wallbacteria bacterium]|nr:response regulator [Candidatus Wallbacteria bacterium]
MDKRETHRSILIVDELEERRVRNSQLLQRAGFAVFASPTGDMALRMFQEFRPAIALVGEAMKPLREVDLCAALRRLPDGATLPIVLLMREEDSVLRAGAFAAGADDVIADSVPPEELLVRIERLSERRHQDERANESDRLDAVFRVAHTIRHGINNPLQVVELGLEMLREKLESDGEALELLGKLSASIDRVRQLMDRLSHLTQLKTNPDFEDRNILDVFDSEAKHVKRLRERGAYRVLVVEDDAGQRLVTTSVLARSGLFTAQDASSGQQALEMAKADPPDVILTDLNMPGLNGFELCERVKADPELAHTVVIVFTVRQSLRDLLMCHELGAANYLVKPIHPARLVEQIFRTMGLQGYVELPRS